MKTWKKVLAGIVVLALVFFGFAAWYRMHFSMSAAQAFEINSPGTGPRVLIATQGSAFKDSIVAGIVAHLKQRTAYLKVVDVSALPLVNPADWNAIVVLHTWEMNRPPTALKRFVDRTQDLHKVVVLSTSGAGTAKLAGVDAISSASAIADVPARVAEIDKRLDSILDSQSNR